MLNFQRKETWCWFSRLHMLRKLLQDLSNGLHVEADVLQQICDARGNRLEVPNFGVEPLELVNGVQLFRINDGFLEVVEGLLAILQLMLDVCRDVSIER